MSKREKIISVLLILSVTLCVIFTFLGGYIKSNYLNNEQSINLAIEACLKDSNISREHIIIEDIDVTLYKLHLAYSIEFNNKPNNDYINAEYKIDAKNRKILDRKIEISDSYNQKEQQTHSKKITIDIEQAKEIAIKAAKIDRALISFKSCKLTQEYTTPTYEIEFHSSSAEYEYEIDAINGEILDFKIEAIK